jgi:hypothetical protein
MSIKHNIKRRMLMVVALAMTVAVLAAGPLTPKPRRRLRCPLLRRPAPLRSWWENR